MNLDHRRGVVGSGLRFTATVCATLLIVAFSPAALAALEVTASQGQAELLTGDTDWRRAVIGRPIVAGSTLTTWHDSGVIIEGTAVQIRLDPFSLVTVERVPPELSIDLNAGKTEVRVDPAEGSTVALRADGFVVYASAALFSVTRRGVTVLEGEVELTDPSGRVSTVSAPHSYSFTLHSP